MIKIKSFLLSLAAVTASTFCLNALANFIPEGRYVALANLAGYNVIHELRAEKTNLTVNGMPATASDFVCSHLYGGPCQVNVSWVTQKDHSAYRITETVRWTTGVKPTSPEFQLSVINDLGQQGPSLTRAQ